MAFNIKIPTDQPWMHQTIAKNAYRKIQRMLEYQTNLDSKVKYVTEPLVDEELEAEVEGGHYSKRNVDRRAKRQEAKTSKLQQKLKWQN